MERITAMPDVCWYGDVLSTRNSFGQIRFKNQKEKDAFYVAKSKITKEFALKLGLDHFMNKPSARGSVMSTVSSKWAKKHVLPTIAKLVIPIKDIDEMESLFINTTFFFGRRDWDWSYENTPPYPVFKKIGGTEFDFACLCQATEQKTFGLILNYMGHSSGPLLDYEKTAIYPNGWSMEAYKDSLTVEDKALIYADVERINKFRQMA